MKPILDSITHKWCSSCKKGIAIGLFSKNKRNRLGLDTYCKSCSLIKAKRFYQNRRTKRQDLKATLILEFGNKCFICRINNLPIASFVFHHHNEKMSDRSYRSPGQVLSSPTVKEITKEKKKWILLCSNCHNLLHSNCKLTALEIKQ